MGEIEARARKLEIQYKEDQGMGRVWNILVVEGESAVRKVVVQETGRIGQGKAVTISLDGLERVVWGGIFLERADAGHPESKTVFRSVDGKEVIEVERGEF